MARIAAVAVILAYQSYDAVAVERIFPTDIRNELADWSVQRAAEGKRVITLDDHLEVRGKHI